MIDYMSNTQLMQNFTKYMHLGYKILQGYKCEVLKIYNQHLKVLKKCYKALR